MKCVFVDIGKHFGGAENYLISVIDQWIQVGNKAMVVVRKNSLFQKELEKKTEIEMMSVGFTFKDVLKFVRYLRRNCPDVININGINSGIFVLLSMTNTPKITIVHSNATVDRADKPKLVQNLFAIMEQYCLIKSQKIISVSNAIRNVLVERGTKPEKISVIHNGVKYIDYECKKYRMNSNDTLKICFVGRLEKVKGCEYLIDALGNISDRNIVCDIYGDGSQESILREKISEKQLSSKVFLKGFAKDIRRKLPLYDVLVMPSLYESSPLTIPEAMNAKTVLVCSNVGGIPELINDKGNGYLFESGNVNQLTRIIEEIIDFPERQIQIAEKAFDDFKKNYTKEIMLTKTILEMQKVGKGNLKR